ATIGGLLLVAGDRCYVLDLRHSPIAAIPSLTTNHQQTTTVRFSTTLPALFRARGPRAWPPMNSRGAQADTPARSATTRSRRTPAYRISERRRRPRPNRRLARARRRIARRSQDRGRCTVVSFATTRSAAHTRHG